MEGGGSQQELDRRLAQMPSITEYEFSLLERGQIRVEGNERFLRLTKALLGESRFETLLAEANGDVIEGRPATKNPTARLIHRIMEGLRTRKKESYPVSKPLGQLSTAQRNPWDN